MEAIPRNKDRVNIEDINEQYLSEFLEALQAALNQMSADGIRISHVPSKSRELSKYMADILDEDWRRMRGMEIQSVGIASISYDDESRQLINMRNKGAMLGDPSVREGYVQGSIARGLEAAGSNEGGSATAFMGMGIGMQGAGNFMGAASQANQRQMEIEQAQNTQIPKRTTGSVQIVGQRTLVTSAQNVGLKGQAPMYVPSVDISHQVQLQTSAQNVAVSFRGGLHAY